MGQGADWGKKNCSNTLVLTALTTMGICNMLVDVFWVLTCTKCEEIYQNMA